MGDVNKKYEVNTPPDVKWEDPYRPHDLEKPLFDELTRSSEEHYISIAENIVDNAKFQLENQNNEKSKFRIIFLWFFIVLLSVQMIAVILFITAYSYCENIRVSVSVLTTFMTAVFVETLGAIIAMIKFSFDSSQEVQILKIMNGVIRGFQKFNNKK